jgi:anti-sigma factor RsiW
MSMNEDFLSGYVDDELTPDERAAVEAELAQSPEWRAVLDELRATRTMLRALPWPDAPADLIAEVKVRDDEDVAVGAPAPVRELRPRWRRPATLIAAASVAAAFVAVLLIPSPDRSETDVPALADAHAVRSSLNLDPIGALATMGITAEPGDR